MNELDDAVVASLHKAGHMQSIFMIMASHSHFRAMIDRRNAQLPESAANLG
ncbi:MAG: hypothetical protein ACI9KD_003264 [Congregibacter sp.]